MSQRNNRRGNKGKEGPLTQDPQDVMSTAMRLQWNIRVLQRHDPKITTIVDQFTYAVLYRYDEDRWIKRGVEGSMFVYTRSDPPRHGFCILNREGAGNFVQPLRKGDEMEVTNDYIIYRPVDVAPDDFDKFIGIWTADIVERKRLSEFMQKIGLHIAKTDRVYSPVLLHQPLERPEDASLPLITPLPPPPGATPKKGRRGGQKQGQGSAQATPPVQNTVVPAVVSSESSSIDSLFAKFAAPTTEPAAAPSEPQSTELRGPALLQSMFASAAAGAGSVQTTTTSTSTVATDTHVATVNQTTSMTAVSAADGVSQGNMIKQLLGIGAAVTSEPNNVDDLFTAASKPLPPSNVPSRSQSIPPGFVPINEDEEQTPPRQPVHMRTPPNAHSRAPEPSTPTPSKPKQHGPNRDLVAYDFEDAGIVSPWMNEPLQRPKQARAVPPSPGQLPQPKAVREKNSRGKRTGSPKPQRQANQQPSRAAHTPQNDPSRELGHQLDHTAAADALVGALNGMQLGDSPIPRESFVQELLSLIHRGDGFIDDVYQRYLAGQQKKVVYLF